MDDAEVGSDAYDKCKDLHNNQWIIIGFTGVPGLVLLSGGGLVHFRSRPVKNQSSQRWKPGDLRTPLTPT